MSGARDDRVVLAAEYVLGLLDPARAAEVAEAASRDPALAGAIAAWLRDLEPLAASAGAQAPHPRVLRRIEATLDRRASPAAPTGARSRGLDRPRRRLAVLAGAAVAAGLAAFVAWRASEPVRMAGVAPVPASPSAPVPGASPAPSPSPPVPQPPAAPPAPSPVPAAPGPAAPGPASPGAAPAAGGVTVAAGALAPLRGGAPLQARVSASGVIEVVVPSPIAVGAQRRLDVWAKPRDGIGPRLLGELPGAGGSLSFGGLPPAGATVMVTDDVRGPAGAKAPGPTLFQGALAPVRARD